MENKSSIPSLCVILLIVLLFASHEIAGVEGGKMCQSLSHGFKGPCLNAQNCGLACRNEGFTGGRCRGIHHRCYCTKLCSASPSRPN